MTSSSCSINFMLNPTSESITQSDYQDQLEASPNSMNSSLSEILQDQSKWAFLSDLAFSDNSSIVPIKPKRKRASAWQIEFLEKVWEYTSFPSTYQRIKIGMKLNMAPRAVQIWFQNKRKALNVRRNNKRKDLLINTKDLSGSSSSYQTPLNSPSTLQPTIKNILNE